MSLRDELQELTGENYTSTYDELVSEMKEVASKGENIFYIPTSDLSSSDVNRLESEGLYVSKRSTYSKYTGEKEYYLIMW